MEIIQVQIAKNTIKDVLLDDYFRVNIITEKLRLGLPKPKPTPYNMKMVNQVTTKPVGLIRDMEIYVHKIPYITTFTILQNNVVDSKYSIMLGRPWLRDVKVAHDQGNNVVTMQGNGIVKTITIIKCLGVEIRKPKFYYATSIKMVSEMKIYHFCYKAKVVLNRNNQFIGNN